MTKERIKGHSIILLVNVMFAINTPISKWMLSEHLSPELHTMLRMLVAGTLFWLASFFFPRERLSLKEIGMLAVCSLGGVALNQMFFIRGLSLTSPIDASVIVTATPIIVMIFAAIILKEPITLRKALGVVLGAAGAIWLITSAQSSGANDSQSNWLGNLLAFASALCYAVYFVFSKPLSEKYQAVTLMKWMFLFAVIFLLPFNFSGMVSADAFRGALDAKAVAGMIYIFVGATFITYLLIPMAVKHIRPTTASMYNYAQPIVSSLLAIAMLQDTLSFSKILSALMIFAGVYCVTTSRRREK